jgi:hypothetical protein
MLCTADGGLGRHACGDIAKVDVCLSVLVGRSVCGCVNVVVGGDGICKWLHGVRMTIARVLHR